MPIRLIEDRSTEDDDVADNAETIKDGECCHQTQEGRLGKFSSIDFCSAFRNDDTNIKSVCLKDLYHIILGKN